MTITTIFDPPTPSDSPEVFNSKAFTLVGDLNTWSGEANQVAADINADVTEPGVVAVGADLVGANTIGTVAGISAATAQVAAIAAHVTAVAAVDTEVTQVAAVAASVPVVAAVDAEVTQVATIAAHVTTVAAVDTEVAAVAGIVAHVTTVAGISTDVTAVAAVDADVVQVAAAIPDIQAAVADLPALAGKVSELQFTAWTQSFVKADPASVAFTKTGAATLSIKAGTYIAVGGSVVHFASATAITMPAHAAGTDYAVWVKDDGSIEATSNHTTPPAAGNWRKIGGYHYGLVAPATTVAGGGFATTGAGMIWTQPDVDKIAGINTYSLWDLRWRPATADPRGMALVDGGTWVDIYLCGSNHITTGTSKYNSDIASGTVLPRKPLEFGGDGTTTYSSLNWWEACEIVRSHGKRLPWNQEFVAAAYGVTEGIAIGGTSSTYPNTMRNAGYTSKYGLEQATGHQWVWGLDSGYRPDGSVSPWAWRNVTGGRGQMYLYTEFANVRALFGGDRGHAGFAGSRASNWYNFPWDSNWAIGLRAACDHLSL